MSACRVASRLRLSFPPIVLLSAIAGGLLLLAGSNPSANAAFTGPLAGWLYTRGATAQAPGHPAGADPFHDLQGFCLIQTLIVQVAGLTTFFNADKSGNITGGCSYSDSTTVKQSNADGTLDLASGEFTISVHKSVAYTLSTNGSQTKTLDLNLAGTLDGSGSAQPTGTFFVTRTDVCNDCQPPSNAASPASTTTGYSYGGTVQMEVGLRAVNSADLSIDHIEVVQVVQDASNTVPLVARKSTVARVFVKGTIPLTGVETTLKGKRGGGDLGGAPHLLSGGIGAVPAPVRTNTNDSFNFLLPDDWTTQGTLTLEAEVKPPPGISDPQADNNKGSTAVAFQERRGMDVRYLPVCVQPGGVGTPSCPSQFVSVYHRFMEKLFPIADGAVLYRPLSVPQWNWPKAITDNAGNYEVSAALRKRLAFIQGVEGTLPDQLAGWLPRSAGNPIYGLSDPIWAGGGGFGRVSVQQDTRDLDALDPAFTLAHEIAHNLGRRHPNKNDSCNAKDAATDWPYATSTIQEIGFDIDQRVVAPNTKKDVMTYCSPPVSNIWISPFSYKKLFEGNFTPQGDAGVAALAATQYLVISGSAKADGSGGTLDPAYVIASDVPGEPSVPNGTHCLHFTGAATSDYCFNLEFMEHRTQAPMDETFFSLKAPLPAGATHVSLMQGSHQLAAVGASAHAPALQITSPSGGAKWKGQQTITWTASDADGDNLTYTALYSPDNGQTWYPLEVDSHAAQFTFDTAQIKGGAQVLFRVLASDGLNTAAQTVGPVRVGGLPGDADCNGEVTSVDALAVLRSTAGLPVTADCLSDANVNCDAVLDSIDALTILRAIAKLPVSLPPGCPDIGAA